MSQVRLERRSPDKSGRRGARGSEPGDVAEFAAGNQNLLWVTAPPKDTEVSHDYKPDCNKLLFYVNRTGKHSDGSGNLRLQIFAIQ